MLKVPKENRAGPWEKASASDRVGGGEASNHMGDNLGAGGRKKKKKGCVSRGRTLAQGRADGGTSAIRAKKRSAFKTTKGRPKKESLSAKKRGMIDLTCKKKGIACRTGKKKEGVELSPGGKKGGGKIASNHKRPTSPRKKKRAL